MLISKKIHIHHLTGVSIVQCRKFLYSTFRRASILMKSVPLCRLFVLYSFLPYFSSPSFFFKFFCISFNKQEICSTLHTFRLRYLVEMKRNSMFLILLIINLVYCVCLGWSLSSPALKFSKRSLTNFNFHTSLAKQLHFNYISFILIYNEVH